MTGYDTEHRKKRIKAIAVQIVTSQVAKGEVDADDDEAFRAAMKQAVFIARSAYDAAVEFTS